MTDYGPHLPTAADVQAAEDRASMFLWMPDTVPAAGTSAALARWRQTRCAFEQAQARAEADGPEAGA
jgi:hypothetical protein